MSNTEGTQLTCLTRGMGSQKEGDAEEYTSFTLLYMSTLSITF